MSTIAENDPYALNPYVGRSFHYLSLDTQTYLVVASFWSFVTALPFS